MPDLKKVIKAIEICYTLGHNCTECPLFSEDDCNDKLMRDALSLLKAQEPVTPLVAGRGKSFETVETWWYECGNCGGVLTLDDKYCRKCGREVKWE